jgi:hypothetical protein
VKGTCESGHPRGEPIGRVVRESDKAIYRERVCLVCGRVQGVARVPKVPEVSDA